MTAAYNLWRVGKHDMLTLGMAAACTTCLTAVQTILLLTQLHNTQSGAPDCTRGCTGKRMPSNQAYRPGLPPHPCMPADTPNRGLPDEPVLPTAANDKVTTLINTAVTIDVLANDITALEAADFQVSA